MSQLSSVRVEIMRATASLGRAKGLGYTATIIDIGDRINATDDEIDTALGEPIEPKPIVSVETATQDQLLEELDRRLALREMRRVVVPRAG